ncbi:hypothetical protein ANO11243_083520 [Dothideomycetidae sp. 11243]|nr:hypothetical protein ANO11243_083520 [fungal sp. No.11243]
MPDSTGLLLTSVKDEPETVSLSTDGDVYIRSQRDSKKRFLSSSIILAQASSVFRAMFKGGFAEARSLDIDEPKLIELDDPEEALELFLQICHHRADGTFRSFTPQNFYSLAIICDKYDCLAVTSWIADFALRSLHHTTLKEAAMMAAAAMIFGRPRRFRQFTISLIVDYNSSLTELYMGEMPLMKPAAVPHHIDVNSHSVDDCPCQLKTSQVGITNLFATLTQGSIARCCGEAITHFTEEGNTYLTACGKHRRWGGAKYEQWVAYLRHNLLSRFRESKEYCLGLCLQCYLDDSVHMGNCTLEEHTEE